MERELKVEREERESVRKAERERERERDDRTEKLLREEIFPFLKRMAEIQAIENALKDARIAGDKALHEGLAKVLMEKLSK